MTKCDPKIKPERLPKGKIQTVCQKGFTEIISFTTCGKNVALKEKGDVQGEAKSTRIVRNSKAAALLGTCKEDAKMCCGYLCDKAEETEVKKIPLWFFVFGSCCLALVCLL